jgi:hypothetical protein
MNANLKARIEKARANRKAAQVAAMEDATSTKPVGSGKLTCPVCRTGKLTYRVVGQRVLVACTTGRCFPP